MVDFNINEYEEPKMLDDNTEIDFRVLDFEFKSSEKADWIATVLQPFNTDVANPATIYQNFFLPRPGDEPQKKNSKLGQLKRFCDSLGYTPPNGKPAREDVLGLTGKAVVGIQKDEGYEAKNRIKKFIKQ